ncbi:DUF6249 domain-containing protein [Parabacteroides sp. PF5-6]|uniref:DUF6249 domain-containing protein n=1 Tax=Parabacteroides sp. PF5-6 TaxID=1742403 RepID=UPI0024060FBA|nr:DUF6249 domain-containing protein [Parabacteroides sp. PF5-6]MDF9829202.1 heme/copper-type cytochrome/quinol oxidase subunit 2 [Parabacteroides sp. PF5-6]
MDDGIVVAILGVICAIGLPVAAAWVIFVQRIRARHEERMEMIRSGVILEEPAKPEKSPNRYPALRNGLFMIGLALGVIVAIWMGPVMNVGDWFDLTIPTMAILFGGVAFVVYFFLARSIQKREEMQDKQI